MMRIVKTSVSCLAVVAGLAAMSLAAGGTAEAAKSCRATMQPVCGVKPDGPQTYNNSCLATADGARVEHLGPCMPLQCLYPTVALLMGGEPMCGRDPLNHQMMTYSNNCAAEYARATWLHQGACKVKR